MKKWKKNAIIIFMLLMAYWGFARSRRFFRERAAAHRLLLRQPQKRIVVPVAADPDDRVALKAEHPGTLQDEKNMKGRTLWVSAGGQVDYYPFNGKSVDFNHKAGELLGAEGIVVRDAIEQAAPRSAGARFPDADAQVLLIFETADAHNPGKLFAAAVGDREGHDYNLLTDQLFFYDDPHTLYAYWGPKVWQAIDTHKAVVGMTERQLQLSLGQVSTPRGDIMGDRSIEYDNQGKPKLVTFEKGKAIQIRDESR